MLLHATLNKTKTKPNYTQLGFTMVSEVYMECTRGLGVKLGALNKTKQNQTIHN
jgi:hypothetical protein